jgi:hypothetical protein
MCCDKNIATTGKYVKKIKTSVGTIDTAAMTSGDVVGTGLMTFDCVARGKSEFATLREVFLEEIAASGSCQKGNMELWLVSGAYSPPASNAAFSLSDMGGDVVAVIPLSNADWIDLPGLGTSARVWARNLNYEIYSSETASAIYGVLVTKSTPDYAANAVITVGIVVEMQ